MVITYGTRTLFKREGAWGHAICKNCGMIVPLDKAEYKRRREARQKAALF